MQHVCQRSKLYVKIGSRKKYSLIETTVKHSSHIETTVKHYSLIETTVKHSSHRREKNFVKKS